MMRVLPSIPGVAAILTAMLASPSMTAAAPAPTVEAVAAPLVPGAARQSGFLMAQQRQLSLREVQQIIQRQVPGRILDASLERRDGRVVFVVRWEPAEQRGRVMFFVVDALSGRIIARQ